MIARLLSPQLQKLAPLTDEEVVARVVEGDTGAFELLMRRHNQRLFRFARSIVGSDAQAEDVVQESYVRAYAALGRFEGRASLITWLSRIVFHEALRARRNQRRHGTVGSSGLEGLPAMQPVRSNSGDMEQRETRRALVSALDALPASQRAVVMLRLVEELSTRETAASLRMTESNVKVTLMRAKRQLAQTLERHALVELREHFSFDGDRCDRIVAGVFGRLGGTDG